MAVAGPEKIAIRCKTELFISQDEKYLEKVLRCRLSTKTYHANFTKELFGFPHSKGYGYKLRSVQNSFQVVDLSTHGCCCKSYGPIMFYHYFICKVHLFVEIATTKKGKREFNKSLENGFKNSLKRLQDGLSVQVTLCIDRGWILFKTFLKLSLPLLYRKETLQWKLQPRL